MTMPTTEKIVQFDFVELLEPADGAVAGERGSVLDFLADGVVMIELKTPVEELDLDRIVVAPLGKLRLIERWRGPTS